VPLWSLQFDQIGYHYKLQPPGERKNVCSKPPILKLQASGVRGGFAPWPSPGPVPWTAESRWGLCRGPDPRYRFALPRSPQQPTLMLSQLNYLQRPRLSYSNIQVDKKYEGQVVLRVTVDSGKRYFELYSVRSHIQTKIKDDSRTPTKNFPEPIWRLQMFKYKEKNTTPKAANFINSLHCILSKQ